MTEALLAFCCTTLLAVAMAVGIHRFWRRCPGLESRGAETGFRRWCVRGLVVPVLAWLVWDVTALWGPAWGVRPLTLDLGMGRGPSFAVGVAVFTLLAGIVWTSSSLLWLLPNAVSDVRRRAELRGWMLVTGVPAILIGSWAVWGHQWLLAGTVLTLALWILTTAALSLAHVPHVDYTRAITRMKSGKYAEAEHAILAQLEEKEDDFEGWMLLATLYVEQFHELAEARATIRALSQQPELTPYQLAHAFNRLADWELELGNDPVGARTALLEIVRSCPGTPFARVAEHRIRQLPLDQTELAEQRQVRTLRLPTLSEQSVGNPFAEDSAVALMEARNEETQLTTRLKHRPDDLPLRIRLARLLAERLDRMDEATKLIRNASQQREITPLQQAELLALEASWELKYRHRKVHAKVLLQRIVQEHPGTSYCQASLRQLELLDQAATQDGLARQVLQNPPRIRIVTEKPSDPIR